MPIFLMHHLDFQPTTEPAQNYTRAEEKISHYMAVRADKVFKQFQLAAGALQTGAALSEEKCCAADGAK